MLRTLLLLLSRLALLVGLFFLSHTGAYAQGTPGNGGTTGGPPAPTGVPLDGGASLLLASGIGLALRKLRRQRRRHA